MAQTLHLEGVPLLVSSSLLRDRGMGQIDVARLNRKHNQDWMIEIYEVKSSDQGVSLWEFKQGKIRLSQTLDFISRLIGISGRIFSIK